MISLSWVSTYFRANSSIRFSISSRVMDRSTVAQTGNSFTLKLLSTRVQSLVPPPRCLKPHLAIPPFRNLTGRLHLTRYRQLLWKFRQGAQEPSVNPNLKVSFQAFFCKDIFRHESSGGSSGGSWYLDDFPNNFRRSRRVLEAFRQSLSGKPSEMDLAIGFKKLVFEWA